MAELVDVFLTVDGLLSILADVPWSGSQVCLSVDHRITGPVDHVISWHGVVTDGRSVWFLADRTGGRVRLCQCCVRRRLYVRNVLWLNGAS